MVSWIRLAAAAQRQHTQQLTLMAASRETSRRSGASSRPPPERGGGLCCRRSVPCCRDGVGGGGEGGRGDVCGWGRSSASSITSCAGCCCMRSTGSGSSPRRFSWCSPSPGCFSSRCFPVWFPPCFPGCSGRCSDSCSSGRSGRSSVSCRHFELDDPGEGGDRDVEVVDNGSGSDGGAVPSSGGTTTTRGARFRRRTRAMIITFITSTAAAGVSSINCCSTTRPTSHRFRRSAGPNTILYPPSSGTALNSITAGMFTRNATTTETSTRRRACPSRSEVAAYRAGCRTARNRSTVIQNVTYMLL